MINTYYVSFCPRIGFSERPQLAVPQLPAPDPTTVSKPSTTIALTSKTPPTSSVIIPTASQPIPAEEKPETKATSPIQNTSTDSKPDLRETNKASSSTNDASRNSNSSSRNTAQQSSQTEPLRSTSVSGPQRTSTEPKESTPGKQSNPAPESSSRSSPESSSELNPKKPLNSGIIVGIVLGGTTLFTILCFTLFQSRRLKKKVDRLSQVGFGLEGGKAKTDSLLWKCHELPVDGSVAKHSNRAELSSRNGPQGELEGSSPPLLESSSASSEPSGEPAVGTEAERDESRSSR